MGGANTQTKPNGRHAKMTAKLEVGSVKVVAGNAVQERHRGKAAAESEEV